MLTIDISSSSGMIDATKDIEQVGLSATNNILDRSNSIGQNGLSSHTIVPVGTSVDFSGYLQKYLPLNTDYKNNVVTVMDTYSAIKTDTAILREYITTVEDNVLTSTGAQYDALSSSVVEQFAAVNGASWYGLATTAVGSNGERITSGFSVGSVGAQNGNPAGSYFAIAADNFMVTAAYRDDIPAEALMNASNDYPEFPGMWELGLEGQETVNTPAFSIRARMEKDVNGNDVYATSEDGRYLGYDIGFNGRAVFENLVDGEGQTIIDGGRITTERIDIGQPRGEVALIGRFIGSFTTDAQATASVTRNEDGVDVVYIEDGDSYFDTNGDAENPLPVMKFWRDDAQVWVTTKGTDGDDGQANVAYNGCYTDHPDNSDRDIYINAVTGRTAMGGDSIVYGGSGTCGARTMLRDTGGSWTEVVLRVNGSAIIEDTLYVGGDFITAGHISGVSGEFDLTHDVNGKTTGVSVDTRTNTNSYGMTLLSGSHYPTIYVRNYNDSAIKAYGAPEAGEATILGDAQLHGYADGAGVQGLGGAIGVSGYSANGMGMSATSQNGTGISMEAPVPFEAKVSGTNYRLVFQNDGNFVLYDGGTATWSALGTVSKISSLESRVGSLESTMNDVLSRLDALENP